MPSANRIILACAGSGKTTTIVDDVCADASRKAALITYTINGTDELVKIACERYRAVPSHAVISTWYAFLLRHFIRPYQTQLYKPRVSRCAGKRRDLPRRRILAGTIFPILG